jgi:enoyl-CoA hydratase/carnithine racemase
MELARDIADSAPLTVAAAKEMVYTSTEMGRKAALRAAYHIFEPVLRSEDALEGPAAFREKRKPNWRGR